MRRRLPAWLLAMALFVALAYLPVFPQRVQVRSSVIGHAGDVISDEWRRDSLRGAVEGLRYAGRGETRWPAIAFAALTCAALSLAVTRATLGRRRHAPETSRRTPD